MRTFFFSDLAHCLNFFSKGYGINIISKSAFIGSQLYPTNKVVNNVEIPLIEINGMQFTTLETLFERLESMGIHYKPFIKLPWTTAYPFFREGEKWYPYPILTKNGEVFVAYTMLKGGIDQNNLNNYWGYGLILISIAALIVIITGPLNLSRNHTRIDHLPTSGQEPPGD